MRLWLPWKCGKNVTRLWAGFILDHEDISDVTDDITLYIRISTVKKFELQLR